MNDDNLKPNIFSKDNQPPPESKRVPKLKTRMKKLVNDNFKKFEELIGKGNIKAWEIALDRGYGKVNQPVEHSGNINTNGHALDDLIKKVEGLESNIQPDIKDK